MLWKDFLYFSKGERRALILLLILITIAGILLILSDQQRMRLKERMLSENYASSDTIKRLEQAHSESQQAIVLQKVTPKVKPPAVKPKETLSERVERLKPSYSKRYKKTTKFPAGTVVELNSADTLTLKKIPGIGSTFSKRIVKYRALLRGFYCVEQLAEVYGIDDERYESLKDWFTVDTLLIDRMPINQIEEAALRRHPYVNYQQSREIVRIRKQKGYLQSWDDLQLLEEFPPTAIDQLSHYFVFD